MTGLTPAHKNPNFTRSASSPKQFHIIHLYYLLSHRRCHRMPRCYRRRHLISPDPPQLAALELLHILARSS